MFEVAEHTCINNNQLRFCKSCGRMLLLIDFCKNRLAKFGYSYRCKECQRKCNAEQKDNRRKFYQRRREDSEYKEIVRRASAKYNRSSKGREASRRNHDKFKESELIGGRKYYSKHRQHRIDYTRQWRLDNPQKARQYVRRYMAKRKNNPLFNFADRLRRLVRKSWARQVTTKRGKTFDLLGYTPQALLDHLSMFLNKLCCSCGNITITIANSHIDHIIPVKTIKTKEDVVTINSLDNLRLICAKCNLIKGAKHERTSG